MGTTPSRILAGIVLAVLLAQPAAAGADDEAAAIRAANEWLALLDASEFSRSWSRASSLFRNAVTEAQWQQSAGAVRGPLGKLVSRRVRSAEYAETLPGAPDGRYVVIQYDAVFEHKRAAVETVTPMHEGGAWKVSGYYLR